MSESGILSRNGKDGVFCAYFRRKENVLELYNVIHPEDHETGVDDIDIVTLTHTMVNGPYNDLGFMAGNRLLVLVEAQTTWSLNILVRCLIYLGKTYNEYITAHRLRVYDAAPVRLPTPELYVIYTKERGELPDTISFSKDLLGLEYPEGSAADVTVKVLYKTDAGNIVDQYIEYTEIFDEQVRLLGYTEDAAREIVRICIERGIMYDYFMTKEANAVVFDYMDNVIAMEYRIEDAKEEGRMEGRAEGRAEEREDAVRKLVERMGWTESQAREALGCAK